MRVLSGIRPSGQLHLGNYLGAIKQWIGLQEFGQTFYMVADLHALTTPYDPTTMQDNIRSVVADYLAAGLDPKRATIFVQSRVPAHAQLMWLLATLTPIGELGRMTQYKEKVASGAPANAGLFNYPILMAADILLYQADRVPVGDDQRQHVELARTLGRRLNASLKLGLPEPRLMEADGQRIMSLNHPEKKMSKTGDEGIALSDEPAVIAKKLVKAVTATTGGGHNPGVENLFTLLRSFADPNTVKRFEDAEHTGTIRYAELKTTLAEAISDTLAPFRKRRATLLANSSRIDRVLAAGAKQASSVANATLEKIYAAAGLR